MTLDKAYEIIGEETELKDGKTVTKTLEELEAMENE